MLIVPRLKNPELGKGKTRVRTVVGDSSRENNRGQTTQGFLGIT